MRTFELHASVKSVSRSAGRSSVAAAAYRAGELLHDKRTGQTHNYTSKKDVLHTQVFTPDNAPLWASSRQSLWQAVETKENRSNSVTAREIEIAFPAEFNHKQRLEAGEVIAKELVKRYGCAVDICHHAPSKKGDERNNHAHLLFTSRGFDMTTKDGWSKTKYRDLNADKITIEGKTTTRAAVEVKALRGFVAQTMNDIAEREGLTVKTEHLSFKERGIDQEPTQKMGQHATQMERKGQKSERGDINREILAANDERQKVKETANVISFEIEKAKRELAREKMLQQHIEASRIQWSIGAYTERQNKAQQDYEKKSKSFFSRIFKTDQRARETLSDANKELARRRQGWAKAIYTIYSDETPEQRAAALKERGFEIKEHPKPKKQQPTQQKQPWWLQQQAEQTLKRQYNAQTKATRQPPRAAKPRQERERDMDFDR